MTERILVIDPGERVGWCHATITERVRPVHALPVILKDSLAPEPGQVFATEPFWDVEVTGHGITPAKDFALKLHEVAGSYDTIVYESYRIYAHMAKQHIGSDIPSAQFVGMVKLCAWLNPRVKLVSQGASSMKTGEKVAPPAIQEILDRLPKSHDEAHDGSALRHLSFYWFKHYA